MNIEELDITVSDHIASKINSMADKFYSDPKNVALFERFMEEQKLSQVG